MKIISRKKIILPLIIIVVIFIFFIFKKEEGGVTYQIEEVERQSIVLDISETGSVEKGQEIDLNFKNSGRIEKIYVKVGEDVKKGDVLAKLERRALDIQLQEAQANYSANKAKLDKLIAGASQQEINASQTKVDNAESALDVADQGLADAYEDFANNLEDVYTKIYNAKNDVYTIQRTYFTENNQEGINVREAFSRIESALSVVNNILGETNYDDNIVIVKNQLKIVADQLRLIREISEKANYRDVISSTNKTLLETHLGYINTTSVNVTNYSQAISAAKSAITTAEGSLAVAQDALDLLLADPREEDIVIYTAQTNSSQSQINLLQSAINDTILKSPVNGQITAINKKEGEVVSTAEMNGAMSILSEGEPQILVDIYEEDIVDIDVGDFVSISLVAFSDQTFTGKVISIDPAQKIIDGVVYYEVTVSFDEIPEKLRPGMSVDIVITAEKKDDVLAIDEDAIQTKEGKKIVEVLSDVVIEEREVGIGINGTNNLVEIISGLNEGEQVIIR